MNQGALNDLPGGYIVTTWKPLGFHGTVSIIFAEAMVLFSISGVLSSHAVHIRSRKYS
jgi:hypothetical protein